MVSSVCVSMVYVSMVCVSTPSRNLASPETVQYCFTIQGRFVQLYHNHGEKAHTVCVVQTYHNSFMV